MNLLLNTGNSTGLTGCHFALFVCRDCLTSWPCLRIQWLGLQILWLRLPTKLFPNSTFLKINSRKYRGLTMFVNKLSALWYSFLLWNLSVLRRWSSPLVASIYSIWHSAWLCLGDWWGLLFGSSGIAAGCLSWEVWWLRTGSMGLAILLSATSCQMQLERQEQAVRNPETKRQNKRQREHRQTERQT